MMQKTTALTTIFSGHAAASGEGLEGPRNLVVNSSNIIRISRQFIADSSPCVLMVTALVEKR
jgi:hypothetical protein